MIAIFMNEENRYLGYKPDVEVGETFELPHRFVLELPPEILNIPAGFCAKYNEETGQFYHEPLPAPPAPPKTPEQIEMDVLKEEITFLRQRDARMQDDINAIFEGMTGGV